MRGGGERAAGAAGLPGGDGEAGPGRFREHRGSLPGRIRWVHFVTGTGMLRPLEPCPWPLPFPSNCDSEMNTQSEWPPAGSPGRQRGLHVLP